MNGITSDAEGVERSEREWLGTEVVFFLVQALANEYTFVSIAWRII